MDPSMDARSTADERIRTLFDLALDMLCVAGFDGRITVLNPAFERVSGYSGDEVMAAPFVEFMHPDDRAAFTAAFHTLRGGHAVVGHTARFRHRDGSYRWLSWDAIPADGSVYAIAHDVTAEREAAERIARFQGLFELAHDLLCIAGLDGTFKLLNPAWERTLGFPLDELAAIPFIDFVHPDDREETVAQFDALAAGVEAVWFRSRFLCLDGTYRWLSWIVTHRDRLLYCVGRDITDRKREEAMLDAALSHAELLLTHLRSHHALVIAPPAERPPAR